MKFSQLTGYLHEKKRTRCGMLRPRNIILYIILFVWDATYPYPINTVKFSWPVGDHINGVPLYLQSIWSSHVSCVKANNTGDNSFSNLSINTSCRQKWKKMLPATYNTYGNMRSNAIQLNATLSRNKLEEKVANITKPLRYLYETLSSCLT